MKTINTFIILCMIFFAANCFGADVIKGKIIDNPEEKVKIINGDRAIVNIGRENSLVKGDILTVYRESDSAYTNPLGKCVLTDVYENKSMCEIIKTYSSEIGRDAVVARKISVTDPGVFPVIFQLLTKIVEPYKAHEDVRVYVHSILDEQNNVTEFSEKLQKEIKNIISQKPRIKLVHVSMPRPLFAYLPSEYAESRNRIENYMEEDNIDVLISGTYRVRENKIELTLYKVDKNWEDLAVDTVLSATPYMKLVQNVVMPYKPLRKETDLVCEFQYKPVYHRMIGRDERNSIIATESKGDPFVEYNMRRTEFNIISPVDFRILIDKTEVRFDKGASQRILSTTGKHEITAVYKKGFFFNDTLLFTSESEISKNIVLILDNPGNIRIEATANPIPGREDINFRIYKTADKTVPDFKSVLLQKNGVQKVETFKD